MKDGVSGVGRVSDDLNCTLLCPGGMQVLDGGQVTANDLLHRPDDALHFAVAVGRRRSKPDVTEEERMDSMMDV